MIVSPCATIVSLPHLQVARLASSGLTFGSKHGKRPMVKPPAALEAIAERAHAAAAALAFEQRLAQSNAITPPLEEYAYPAQDSSRKVTQTDRATSKRSRPEEDVDGDTDSVADHDARKQGALLRRTAVSPPPSAVSTATASPLWTIEKSSSKRERLSF